MTNLNTVVLVGNLTRNVTDDERDFGYFSNGNAHARLSIAVNRSHKSGDNWVDEVFYFEIQCTGKTAENLKPYFVKGQKIAVQGYLKQERWTDKEGKSQSKVFVQADHIELIGGTKNSENSENKNANTNTSFETHDGSFGDVPF